MLPPCGRLLDAGCGTGGFLRAARGKYREAFAVDISAAALRRVESLAAGSARVDLDREEIPFKDMDTAVCLDVIEHVFSPPDLLRKLAEVLRPGGNLIISTPNIRKLSRIKTLLHGGRFPRTSTDLKSHFTGGHLHYFTFSDLAELLRLAGFRVEREEGLFCKSGFSGKEKLLRRFLGLRLFREFFAEGIIVLGRKK
jgi:2-polyprenyl-3-methyl-5-hydroxy-6-metoxy-1,4-benzoquinol methylase